MNDRQRPRRPMADILDALVGHPIAGGCPDCGAVQSMRKDDFGVYVLTIEHDSTCPELARMEGRR